jgi:ubiquinone/menaquinone biosynthesis C-methylase UbiE
VIDVTEKVSEELIHQEVQNVINVLKGISGGKVLDIATGEGVFIKTLMKTLGNYDNFTAIELSEEELEKAKKELKEAPVSFFQMNAENLEFKDHEFDTVCLSHSLHHLDNIELVLSEMLRVLKPNGNFILQECYSDGEQTEAQVTDILIHHWDAIIDRKRGIPHNETLTKMKICDYIKKLPLTESRQFDIPYSVACAFCEKFKECSNPKSKTAIDGSNHYIDSILKNAIKYNPNNTQKYENKAMELRERLNKFGNKNASSLFFLGKK